jgi:hypothetical protein
MLAAKGVSGVAPKAPRGLTARCKRRYRTMTARQSNDSGKGCRGRCMVAGYLMVRQPH